MLFARRRIQREATGNYVLRLPDEERTLLATLPEQLKRALGALGADAGIPDELRRLFPHAYPTDAEAESAFVNLVRDDLVAHHQSALEVLTRTAAAHRISELEADAWLAALNDLRLVFGSRLQVTEEPRELDPSDDMFSDWVCYHYLSYLQGELVEAMTDALPPPSPGAGDDLPDDPWGDPLGGLRWDGTPGPPVP